MRSKFLTIVLSFFLAISTLGCAAKVNSDNEIVKRLDRVSAVQEGLVNANLDVNLKLAELSNTSNVIADKIGKVSNAGAFSGGGVYLTIVSVVLALIPPICIMTYLYLKQKQGWNAFRLLKEAHAEVAEQETESSVPSTVIKKFLEKAQASGALTWMSKNKACADLLTQTPGEYHSV